MWMRLLTCIVYAYGGVSPLAVAFQVNERTNAWLAREEWVAVGGISCQVKAEQGELGSNVKGSFEGMRYLTGVFAAAEIGALHCLLIQGWETCWVGPLQVDFKVCIDADLTHRKWLGQDLLMLLTRE